MSGPDRTPDGALFTADDFVRLGNSKGFTEQDWLHAVAREYHKVERPTVSQIVHTDPRVQSLLKRLHEKDLSVPANLPQTPDNVDLEKFPFLTLVLPQVPLEQVIDAVEVRGKKLVNYLDLSKVTDEVETPNEPYFIRMQNGLLYKGKSPDQATAIFADSERGTTLREGLFLLLCHPEITLYDSNNPESTNNIDLPGSRYNRGFVPYLFWYDGLPELNAYYSGNADSRYGSSSVGVSNS